MEHKEMMAKHAENKSKLQELDDQFKSLDKEIWHLDSKLDDGSEEDYQEYEKLLKARDRNVKDSVLLKNENFTLLGSSTRIEAVTEAFYVDPVSDVRIPYAVGYKIV